MKTHLPQTKPYSLTVMPLKNATPDFPQDRNQSLMRISSPEILRGQREVEIEHNGMIYRMRCTALGKLILTK
jgi:hemin uptake protein HemP